MIAELFPWTDAALDRKIAARQARLEADMVTELRWRWQAACERPALQLSHGVTTAGGGFGPGRAPLIREIELGSVDDDTPCTFVVELRPGQIVADLEDASRELAGALLAHKLAFAPVVGTPLVRVTIIEDDPHAAGSLDALSVVPGRITLGLDEYGETVAYDPADMFHVACQGSTRAGKSTLLHTIMSQIVSGDGMRLAGIDPQGVIFRCVPDDPLIVNGGADVVGDALAVLDALTDEMERRLRALPWDQDKLPCGVGTDHPWLFTVLEEFPGLLDRAAASSKANAEKVKSSVARLIAESHKTGMRFVLASQRFDAASVAGAAVRGNCACRLSYRVENKTCLEFLHEDVTPDVVSEHVRARAGIALLTYPGEPLRRIRTPFTSYQAWAHTARRYAPSREEVPAA
jgi:hypothetical protein